MGMRENPNGGYVVELDELKKILPVDKIEALDKLIDDFADDDTFVEFLNPIMQEMGFPKVWSVWFADEDFASDDLEQGKFYVSFDENDLFIIEPKDEYERLTAKGIKPQLSFWTVRG